MRIKVEEDHSLVRDSVNSAILNTDAKALADYRRNRDQKLSLQNQVDNLKSELDQIRELINIHIKNKE